MIEADPSDVTNRRQHQSSLVTQRAPTKGRSHWNFALVFIAVFLLLLIAIAGTFWRHSAQRPPRFSRVSHHRQSLLNAQLIPKPLH